MGRIGRLSNERRHCEAGCIAAFLSESEFFTEPQLVYPSASVVLWSIDSDPIERLRWFFAVWPRLVRLYRHSCRQWCRIVCTFHVYDHHRIFPLSPVLSLS